MRKENKLLLSFKRQIEFTFNPFSKFLSWVEFKLNIPHNYEFSLTWFCIDLSLPTKNIHLPKKV